MALIDHLEKIRHFHQAAKFTSISKAAQSIGMSQAGLSKCISNLENILEVQLFLRSKDGLVITPEGQKLLVFSEELIQITKNVEAIINQQRSTLTPKTIKVGMYDSIAVYLYPALQTHLSKTYPNLEIELNVDSSLELYNKLVSGNLDFSIGVNLHKFDLTRIEVIDLYKDNYGFFCSYEDQKNLDQLPFIVHDNAEDLNGVKVKDRLLAKFKSRSFICTQNFETVKLLTAKGIGIGVLPQKVVFDLVKTKSLKQIEMTNFRSTFGMHKINLGINKKLIKNFESFTKDITHFCEYWAKMS